MHMSRRQIVKLFKRGLTLDGNFALAAVYEEQGSFEGSLWPARATGQGEGQRYLLVAQAGIGLEVYDRIETAQGLFRVLGVRAFPKHTEALLEKETQAP
jgi:hypothetical protein